MCNMRVMFIFSLLAAFLVWYDICLADLPTAIPDAKFQPSSTSISGNDRLDQLEKTVKELKDKRKDTWDKFQILAGLLIPASIALVGRYYANALKKLEIERTEIRSTSEQRIAEINARVRQAELLSTFMEALVSDDSRKRALAARAISFALPENAPALLKVIADTDPDETVRKAARESSLENSARRKLKIWCNSSLGEGIIPDYLWASSTYGAVGVTELETGPMIEKGWVMRAKDGSVTITQSGREEGKTG